MTTSQTTYETESKWRVGIVRRLLQRYPEADYNEAEDTEVEDTEVEDTEADTKTKTLKLR